MRLATCTCAINRFIVYVDLLVSVAICVLFLQRAIINCTVDTDSPLLELDNLLVIIEESETSDVSTIELIQETNKNIRAFDQQSLAYKSLSEYASLLYTCVHTIRHSFQYFQFPLCLFESLFSEVLVNSCREVKVSDNLMAINAHVLYLRHQLLAAVCNALKVRIVLNSV